MKRSHKRAIIAIVNLIFLYALCFLGNSIKYGCIWINAWEALKTLVIALGISAVVFIVAFISYKWLEG